MKKRHMLLITAASLSLMLFAGCGSKEQKDQDSQEQAITQEETAGQDTETSQEGETETSSRKDLFNSMNTEDLEGNAVDTSLFSQAKMTMVNVWNTGCGPCIHEVPILDQLNKDLAQRDIAIKGMIYEFTPGLSEAGRSDVEAILSDAGATYQNLLISEDMYDSPTLRQLTAFPTTYFVDPEGEIIASAVGAHDYDGWMNIIEQALELLEKDA